MATKLARDAARALTNDVDFKRGNIVIDKQFRFINVKVHYDVAHTYKLYDSTIAYVHCGMLYITIPEGLATKTTMDKVVAILEMWGKYDHLSLLKKYHGKFFNLGRMS